MLDIRDWRPDLGEHGKLHVRFGKGSRGRGPKTRLVPGDQRRRRAAGLVADRRAATSSATTRPTRTPRCCPANAATAHGRCHRVGADALRTGLAAATEAWLPAWQAG